VHTARSDNEEIAAQVRPGYEEASIRAARARLLRRIGRSVLNLTLGIVLLIGLAVVLTPVSALIFAPWAMGQGGSPTLTGTWVGPLRSKWGSEYHLYLDLGWEPPRGRTSRASLTGSAWICNRVGTEFHLEVSGDADRGAQDVRVDVEARDSRYRESLPLRGAWHGDTLQLTAFTSPFGPEGELRGGRSSVSSTHSDATGRSVEVYPTGLGSDQVPADSFPAVTLRKGSEAEYQAGCRGLQG
jgi:hypothetical protein